MLAIVAAVAALQVATPCQDPAAALQCPDLVMAPADGLREQRVRGGRVLLRMRNQIMNLGAGPAELFGERIGPREMSARQVIADGFGVRRRFETGAELYYTSVPTRGGFYWKFDHAAQFELWSLTAEGRPYQQIRTGPKLRYCLRDLARVRDPFDLPGTPTRAFFPACNQRRAKREVTLGTSVGWADVYPSSYPGNAIDVTGLVGCFAVIQRADPRNHIFEIDESNNESARVVRLPYRRGPQGCPPFVAG